MLPYGRLLPRGVVETPPTDVTEVTGLIRDYGA
jgi:hypothetical protein